jgi:hypothetical protein
LREKAAESGISPSKLLEELIQSLLPDDEDDSSRDTVPPDEDDDDDTIPSIYRKTYLILPSVTALISVISRMIITLLKLTHIFSTMAS